MLIWCNFQDINISDILENEKSSCLWNYNLSSPTKRMLIGQKFYYTLINYIITILRSVFWFLVSDATNQTQPRQTMQAHALANNFIN